jgi:hypothetical protein
MSTPAPRSQRLARIRRTVAGGTLALFVASLLAVVAWGRQPVTSHASAATQGAASQSDPYGTAPNGEDGYGDDDGYNNSIPYDYGTAPSQSSQAPAPLTTRTS